MSLHKQQVYLVQNCESVPPSCSPPIFSLPLPCSIWGEREQGSLGDPGELLFEKPFSPSLHPPLRDEPPRSSLYARYGAPPAASSKPTPPRPGYVYPVATPSWDLVRAPTTLRTNSSIHSWHSLNHLFLPLDPPLAGGSKGRR